MCGTVFYSSLLYWSSLILKFDRDLIQTFQKQEQTLESCRGCVSTDSCVSDGGGVRRCRWQLCSASSPSAEDSDWRSEWKWKAIEQDLIAGLHHDLSKFLESCRSHLDSRERNEYLNIYIIILCFFKWNTIVKSMVHDVLTCQTSCTIVSILAQTLGVRSLLPTIEHHVLNPFFLDPSFALPPATHSQTHNF